MPFEQKPHSSPTRVAVLAGVAPDDGGKGSDDLRPNPPASLPLRTTCRIVRQMIAEMTELTGDRIQLRRDRRRTACHVRQIAMYVCHVALEIPMNEIGDAFGRDRSTVGHACGVVEDRRDDPAFDDFVSAIERIATAVFAPARGACP